MIVNNRNDSLSRSLSRRRRRSSDLWPGHLALVGRHSENIYEPIKHLSITLQRVQCSMSCQVMFVVQSTRTATVPPHPFPSPVQGSSLI